jgi:dTDP-glucose 4,6-dehydratase
MRTLPPHPLASDLDDVLVHVGPAWELLRNQRIFITGGTGFFGIWMLETLLWANERLDLGTSVTVLTRDPGEFARRAPHIASAQSVSFHVGDIRSFEFPAGRFSHIVHAAATSAVATFLGEDPLVKFCTVAGGTRRVLEFAAECEARRLLFTSSGAVYGKQPAEMSHIPEDYPGAPDPSLPASALGEGKRVAEFLCADFARKYGTEVAIARCFSFIGPHLQLDIHYAAGNFIRDAVAGRPIRVTGDGTPYRSYLYAADLVAWLWTILLRGENGGVYNTGSRHAISIAELARLVAACAPKPVDVIIGKSPDPLRQADRYVPCTRRANEQLGLQEWTPVETAIRRTIDFYCQMKDRAA